MSRPPQHPVVSFTVPQPTARRAPVQTASVPTPPHSSPASSPSPLAAATPFIAYPQTLSPPQPFFATPSLPRSPHSYTAAAANPHMAATQPPSHPSASLFALGGGAAGAMEQQQQQQQATASQQQQMLYLAQSMQYAALTASAAAAATQLSHSAMSTSPSPSSDAYQPAVSLLSAQPAFVTHSLNHAGLPLTLPAPSPAQLMAHTAAAASVSHLPSQPFNFRSHSSPSVGAALPVPVYITPQQQQQHYAFNPALHYPQPQQHPQQPQPPFPLSQQQQSPSVINVLYSTSTPSAAASVSSMPGMAHFQSVASMPAAHPTGSASNFLMRPSQSLTSLGSYGSQQSELSVVSPAPSSESLLSVPTAGMELNSTSPSATDRTASQLSFQCSPNTSPPRASTRLLQHNPSASSSSQLSTSVSSHVLLPAQPGPTTLAGAMAAPQMMPSLALTAAYVESSQRLLMEQDHINSYLHALLASHQAGTIPIMHERAELLKRLALDKLKQASVSHSTPTGPYSAFSAAPVISQHLQAVLTQFALTLPHTNAGFFSELAAISSPATAHAHAHAVPSILLPQQPLGARSFSAPSPILSPTAMSAAFFTPSALTSATASPSSSPSSSSSSSPSMLERTTGRSASTSCKYCGRTWLLSSLSSPSSREKRNKQLKAKRDHQPFCVANPQRVLNLDKRRRKKKRREERDRRSNPQAEGGGGADGEYEEDDDDSGVGDDTDDDIDEGEEEAEQAGATAAGGSKRKRHDSSGGDAGSSATGLSAAITARTP